MSSSLARSALWYARHGWRVLPCIEGKKLPAIKAWNKLATTDLRQVETWWRIRPDGNIGCAAGPQSGIFVIDVDQNERADGEATLVKAQAKWGMLPATVEQRTGSGGRQLLFAYPQGHIMRNKAGPTGIGIGVDTRGDGGFVIVPPSLHPCGKPYHWIIGPHQAELAQLPPSWIKALELKPQPPRISVPVTPLRNVGDVENIGGLLGFLSGQHDGNRNNALYWTTRKVEQLRRLGFITGNRDHDLAQAALNAGLDQQETKATIASAKRAEEGCQ